MISGGRRISGDGCGLSLTGHEGGDRFGVLISAGRRGTLNCWGISTFQLLCASRAAMVDIANNGCYGQRKVVF